MKFPVNISNTTVKWTARYSGMVFAVLILALGIGEGVKKEELSDLNTTEYLFIGAFSAIWLGYAFGWSNEKWGTILILGGWLAFYMINFIDTGRFPRGFFMVSLVFPGILYLVYLFKDKKHKD
jgi:hypothetical protein